MIDNKKNKKSIFLPFLSLLMVITIMGGVTYAIFNYRKSFSSNIIRTGNVEFRSSATNVILHNIFPISSSAASTDVNNVQTVTITINGKTTFEDGIEYLVSFTDLKNTINSKMIPISLLISIDGLGNSDSGYFTNRGLTKSYLTTTTRAIYDRERILVGFIPSSDTLTTGTITIKAYVDSNDVIVTDTYDGGVTSDFTVTDEQVEGKVLLTTEEWNNFRITGLSFRVKIEAYDGIWVEDPFDFYDLIEKKATTAPTYVKSYKTEVLDKPAVNTTGNFTTQDTVETNNDKKEVFYYTGSDAITNGNVLFAGFCWQIVRTTDNGGIRLIYNGIAENNQCTASRSNNTYRGVKATSQNIVLGSSPYLYGDSYDYDLATGKFHLVNPESGTRTWTYATYESFIGKYTCMNDSGLNCDYVWHVGEYAWSNSAQAETTKYSIGNLDNYREMGSSSFNAGYSSLSNVGYMYNKIYNARNMVETGAIYGRDVEYDTTNGTYLVVDSTSGQASSYIPDVANDGLSAEYHYTCGLDTNNNNSPITTCATVRYYFVSAGGTYFYIELVGGEKVEDALKKMINYKQSGDNIDENINVISSSMKDYLEIWYDKNLKAYEEYLDTGAVYCNNRTVTNLSGWNKTNGTYKNNWLNFKQWRANLDLACENVTDRFSKENSKARIKNPIGLITEPERGLMGTDYAATGSIYWGLSPDYFNYSNAHVHYIDAAGALNRTVVSNVWGVRAAITLKPDTVILVGDGTDIDPYQIGPPATVAN